MRAIEIFPARLVIGFFRLQYRGARQQQQMSDNDSPSAGAIPASSLPHFLALFASRIIALMAEMWDTNVEVDCTEISRIMIAQVELVNTNKSRIMIAQVRERSLRHHCRMF